MRLVVLLVVLVVIYGISGIFRRKCEDNMGKNIGEKHMKDQWGIEDNNLYHD